MPAEPPALRSSEARGFLPPPPLAAPGARSGHGVAGNARYRPSLQGDSGERLKGKASKNSSMLHKDKAWPTTGRWRTLDLPAPEGPLEFGIKSVPSSGATMTEGDRWAGKTPGCRLAAVLDSGRAWSQIRPVGLGADLRPTLPRQAGASSGAGAWSVRSGEAARLSKPLYRGPE
ncbi:hypothetical protein NDU88_006691 [Pleurodeles waltl]|uniref:Uncharacterized protein n=1 Tax=Pleurodeles waltl TaxID=8319 RepID=A0AAV7RSQ6_PLEWA|nr:hypothetical protein NDU88_006691 [Pleurodeles waltl]